MVTDPLRFFFFTQVFRCAKWRRASSVKWKKVGAICTMWHRFWPAVWPWRYRIPTLDPNRAPVLTGMTRQALNRLRRLITGVKTEITASTISCKTSTAETFLFEKKKCYILFFFLFIYFPLIFNFLETTFIDHIF